MASRFLYLLVLSLLRWHPSDFSRCHWLPQIWAAIFSLEIEPSVHPASPVAVPAGLIRQAEHHPSDPIRMIGIALVTWEVATLMSRASIANWHVHSPEQAPCALALRHAILMPMSASTKGSSLIDPHQQMILRQLVQAGERGDKTASQIAQRARIVLLASEGRSLEDIARQEGISMRTAWAWRTDFMRDGVPALTPKRCNPPHTVSVNDQQHAALEELLVAGQNGNPRAQKIARRAKAILLAAQGAILTDICRELDVGYNSVVLWFERFARLGMDGIVKERTCSPLLQPTAQQRRALQKLVRAGRNGDNVDQDLAMRAKIVLMASAGKAVGQIQREMGIPQSYTVTFWRERFARQGMEGITRFRRSAAPAIALNDGQRTELRRLAQAGQEGDAKGRNIAHRAHIVLLAAEGKSLLQIGRTMGVDRSIVRKWRQRFIRLGVAGLTAQRIKPLPVSARQKAALLELANAGESGDALAQSVALRARIILLAATGMLHTDIVRELNVDHLTVCRWRKRFASWGVRGITAMRRTQVSGMTAAQRSELERMVQAGEQGDQKAQIKARRAKAILLSAEGKSQIHIGRELGVSSTTVWGWLEQFVRLGVPGITSRIATDALVLPVSASQRQVLSRLADGSQPHEVPDTQ